MTFVTRTEFWEEERSRVESRLQEDLQMLAESKQPDRAGNPPREKWHLRSRGDEITDIHKDAVRHSTTLPTNFLFRFSSTSAGYSSLPYSHTVGGMMNLCFAT